MWDNDRPYAPFYAGPKDSSALGPDDELEVDWLARTTRCGDMGKFSRTNPSASDIDAMYNEKRVPAFTYELPGQTDTWYEFRPS